MKFFSRLKNIVKLWLNAQSILKFVHIILISGDSKGEFTQYPFFVLFCPLFYVFASPWQSMRFFIRIFMCPYPHKPDSHILDKGFPKKIFCKGVQLCF